MSSRRKEGTENYVCGLAGSRLSSGVVPVLALRSSEPARQSALHLPRHCSVTSMKCFLPVMELGFGENQTVCSMVRPNLRPVCRLGGLGFDSTHTGHHTALCTVARKHPGSWNFLFLLALSLQAIPAWYSKQKWSQCLKMSKQLAFHLAVSPPLGFSGFSAGHQLLSLWMGSIQLEKGAFSQIKGVHNKQCSSHPSV